MSSVVSALAFDSKQPFSPEKFLRLNASDMWPTEFKSAMIMEIKDLIQLLPGFLDNDFHGTQNMLTHGLLHT